MSEGLPQGWAVVQVQELFHSFSGGTPSKGNPAYWGGKIPWFSSGDIKSSQVTSTSESITQSGLENSSARLCRPGSVLVVVRSGVLKHTLPVAILEREAAINQDLKCFDSGNDAINKWLALSLRASESDLLALNREGTTVQSVKYDTLKKHELPLPPLAEQRRIVAKLEVLLGKVDACRNRLEKIPAILKRFRQSVLAAGCSGRLTSDWRGVRHNSEEFPDGWKLRKLDSLFTIRTGGTPSRKVKEYFEGGTIPWVKTGEVQNCDIRRTEEFITEAAVNASNAKAFPSGTIVVAMYGEGRTRGQIGRLTFPAATNQACAALINTDLPRVTSQFVFYTLLGQYDLLRAQSAGGNQPNLNLGIIKEWKIPMPPLPEQQEIVRRVEALFALAEPIETRYAKAKTHVDRLTQSILAKAFRGDLVPQNQNDEPATVLLERIRSQRRDVGVARSQPRRKGVTTAGATALTLRPSGMRK